MPFNFIRHRKVCSCRSVAQPEKGREREGEGLTSTSLILGLHHNHNSRPHNRLTEGTQKRFSSGYQKSLIRLPIAHHRKGYKPATKNTGDQTTGSQQATIFHTTERFPERLPERCPRNKTSIHSFQANNSQTGPSGRLPTRPIRKAPRKAHQHDLHQTLTIRPTHDHHVAT